MIYTGKYAGGSDVYWLTAIQLGIVALLSTLMALSLGDRVIVWHPEVLECAGDLRPFRHRLCICRTNGYAAPDQPDPYGTDLCMEPVFAALYAYLMLGERFGITGFIGAILILAGMVLSEIPRPGEMKDPAGRSVFRNE